MLKDIGTIECFTSERGAFRRYGPGNWTAYGQERVELPVTNTILLEKLENDYASLKGAPMYTEEFENGVRHGRMLERSMLNHDERTT